MEVIFFGFFYTYDLHTNLVLYKLIILFQGIAKVIDEYVGNTSNPGLELAKMLQKEISVKFAYVHDPSDKEFSPVFLTATFFSPSHRFLLTEEQITIVETFLRGISTLIL